MKAIRTWIGCTLLTGAVPMAWAQSSVDLSVTGSIVPAACTPQLNTQAINFGRFSYRDLNVQEHTATGVQHHTLTIRCDAPAVYALRATDNRKGSAHGKPDLPAPLGMGLTPQGEKIGGFHLEVRAGGSNIDGKPVFFSVGSADAGSWSPSSSLPRPIHSDGDLLALVDGAGLVSGPSRIREAQLQLVASGHIAPALGLTLTEDVRFDGHATLELIYL